MIKLVCNKCKKEYEVHNYRKLLSRTCSRVCHNSIAGQKGGRAGKGVSRGAGRKNPELAERNKKIRYIGVNHVNWKADSVGYTAMHVWVRRHYGKPTKCERCFSEKNIQWANKSHKYLREDRNDWMQLCSSCHQKYDKTEMKHSPGRFKNKKINEEYCKKLSTV